jgi:hypothetical protein
MRLVGIAELEYEMPKLPFFFFVTLRASCFKSAEPPNALACLCAFA